jgi:hypothetical protein
MTRDPPTEEESQQQTLYGFESIREIKKDAQQQMYEAMRQEEVSEWSQPVQEEKPKLQEKQPESVLLGKEEKPLPISSELAAETMVITPSTVSEEVMETYEIKPSLEKPEEEMIEKRRPSESEAFIKEGLKEKKPLRRSSRHRGQTLTEKWEEEEARQSAVETRKKKDSKYTRKSSQSQTKPQTTGQRGRPKKIISKPPVIKGKRGRPSRKASEVTAEVEGHEGTYFPHKEMAEVSKG